ncbi:MAG: hypothetical protein WBH85_10590 [Thermoanaerobaculia bacterium]
MIFEGMDFWKFELLLLGFVFLLYVPMRFLLSRGGKATSRIPEVVFAVVVAIAVVGGYFFWLYYLVQWE